MPETWRNMRHLPHLCARRAPGDQRHEEEAKTVESFIGLTGLSPESNPELRECNEESIQSGCDEEICDRRTVHCFQVIA